MPAKNKKDAKIQRRRFYLKHTAKVKAENYARRNEIKKWFQELKKKYKCNRCSEDHVACLHFHHKNPEEKFRNIATMPNDGFSKKRILEEIAKCEVLCANCHAKEHFRDR